MDIIPEEARITIQELKNFEWFTTLIIQTEALLFDHDLI